MGKKKGAKKGAADDFWEEAGESIDNNNDTAAVQDDLLNQTSNQKNLFAAMSLDDDQPKTKDVSPSPALQEDNEDDFGGLMGAIKSSAKKGKKDKKKKDDDFDFDEFGVDVGGNAKEAEPTEESKTPVEATVEEEFPDTKNSQTKGNKQTDTPPVETNDGSLEPEAPRLLTKKEKEKLKKEKEKAKKRAQAAAKKANDDDGDSLNANTQLEPTQQDSKQPEAGDDDDEEGDNAAASSDKKKKKKKKKAAEPVAAPAPAPTKKPNAMVAALQARIVAQRKAEEEAQRAEEELQRQEEERERIEKKENDLKEAERQKRKEKERAKKEQLRKEGKLLTPKQKAEKAAAEARLKAMIESGQIKVEGLQRQTGSDGKPSEEKKKKVVYDNRKKKKGPQIREGGLTIPEPITKSQSVPEQAVDQPAAPLEPTKPEEETKHQEIQDPDVQDSWDAESDGDVKDSWDAGSDEDDDGKANGTKSADQQAAAQDSPSDDSEDDSDGSDEGSESESDDGLTTTQRVAAQRKAAAAERKKELHEQALAARNKDDLRSPICCILGHVDTGKTKLLDKIRQTNVQEGEAGGITQQIGATYFPTEAIKTKTAVLDKDEEFEYKVPGLLVIDTPGHESFTNLRTRGSSLCNIAVLVVDIMHGLEPQTLESIRLLRDKKTPFIVALNKIDRLYGWQATPNGAFQESLAKQQKATRNEFEERVASTIVAFAEQGLNACLYHDNKNMGRNVSLVPTSAHTGEGIPDMLRLIVDLTQTRMSEKLMYLSELECTVLEVKVIEGLGTTIDVVLSNGVMREGDRIVICGLNGPIVTQIRALLTPQPLKEMRVKGSYVHHKEVKAALGVKISAPDLEKAIAGSRLLVVGPDDDEDDLREEVMSDLTGLLNSIDTSGRGVCVQASTLGSLEALLEFLRVSKIPVNGINIGPVYKKDVMRCATMLEKAKELAVILAFDVTVDKDAEKMAEELGIKIFTAKIIYHLENDFTRYHNEIMESRKKEASGVAVWPCRLKTIACFAKRDPIILGCDIIDGSLRVGTPLCVVKTDPVTRKKTVVPLGRVTSLEINHKEKDVVLKKDVGGGVAVKIEHASHESTKMFGRHFEESDEIISQISRASIDALKQHFWDGISIDEKRLIKKLKGELDIL